MARKVEMNVCEYNDSNQTCDAVIKEEEQYCYTHKRKKCDHNYLTSYDHDYDINCDWESCKIIKKEIKSCINCNYQISNLISEINVSEICFYLNDHNEEFEKLRQKVGGCDYEI